MAERRLALLTVDFEAFYAEQCDSWMVAMAQWAKSARSHKLPFAIFLSLEHVAVLRRSDPDRYRRFTEELAVLERARNELHVHNHCLFDWDSGVRSVDRKPFSNPVAGYPGRASMWYDVVRRNRHSWADWAAELRDVYNQVLVDAGLPLGRPVAFRAGGWDTGTSADDWRAFVSGIDDAGFAADSSRLNIGGRTGTFSHNAYHLTDAVIELAPCIWLNCGAAGRLRRWPSPPSAALRQWPAVPWLGRSGVMVVVVHFDHLFHGETRRTASKFALIGDKEAVRRRIGLFMDFTASLLERLKLTPCRVQEALELVKTLELTGSRIRKNA